MNLYSTYSCKIKHYNYILKQTVVIYISSVDYCIQVCLQHWDELSLINTNLQKRQCVEQMIHSTKCCTAIYDFDKKFYKFPSYLRRAAITEATIAVMKADGTVLGRHFLRLTKEYDSLTHAINRIKKAQQHGNRKMPRLWAKVNGLNDNIATKTATFIMIQLFDIMQM